MPFCRFVGTVMERALETLIDQLEKFQGIVTRALQR